eukprot:10330829-Alexandrium_andersonii.AAC.1
MQIHSGGQANPHSTRLREPSCEKTARSRISFAAARACVLVPKIVLVCSVVRTLSAHLALPRAPRP